MENSLYIPGSVPAGVQGNSLASQFAGIGSPSMLAAPKPVRAGAKVPAKATQIGTRYHQDGTVMTALDTANSVGNNMFMGEFMFPIVGAILSNTIGRIPYIGKQFNTYLGAVTVAPLKAMQHTTLGDVGQFGNHYKRAWAAYATDPKMRTAGGETFETWKAQLGDLKAAENAPKHFAAGSGAFGTGLVQQFAARGATSNLNQLQGDTNTILKKLSGQSETFFGKTLKTLGFATGALAGAGDEAGKAVGGLFERGIKYDGRMIPDHYRPLAAAMHDLQTEVGKAPHLVDLSAAHKHYDAANVAYKALGDGHKTAAGEVGTLLEEAHGKLRATGSQLYTARSSEGAMQAIGTAAKNASLWNVGLKGGLGLGTVYFAGKAATGARDSIRMLQEAAKDLTGREPSTLEILFSANSLPPILREARGNMMARLIPETMGALVSGGLNILFMKRHLGVKENALMIGGFMTQMAAHNLTPAENFLDAYINTKDMQKAGQIIPLELYLELINATSADARAAGGSGNRLVQAVAADYAKEQTPVAAMLKEIEAKEPYMKRAAAALEKLKAADAAKHVTPAHKGAIGEKEKAPAAHPDKPTKIALSDAAHQGKMVQQTQHEVAGV